MNPLETFTIFIQQYWWFALLLIVVPIAKLFTPSIKGKSGEAAVNLAARLRLDPSTYHLIKDVTLPTRRGTTQIDHIIISKFGIFVIETKNYKGWIFADEKSQKWTQINFRQKHQFQNPLRQNYAHICALSELLELPKDKIQGIVCFMGDAKFKTKVPRGVFIQGRYIGHIKSFRTEMFAKKDVDAFVRRIEENRLKRGFKTNHAHVQELKNRLGALIPEEKTCPKCGSAMVVRTAKRGTHAGSKFWGCSRYPACRSTQPMAN